MAFDCQRFSHNFLTFSHFLSLFIIFYHFKTFFTTLVVIIYIFKILAKLILANLGTKIDVPITASVWLLDFISYSFGWLLLVPKNTPLVITCSYSVWAFAAIFLHLQFFWTMCSIFGKSICSYVFCSFFCICIFLRLRFSLVFEACACG